MFHNLSVLANGPEIVHLNQPSSVNRVIVGRRYFGIVDGRADFFGGGRIRFAGPPRRHPAGKRYPAISLCVRAGRRRVVRVPPRRTAASGFFQNVRPAVTSVGRAKGFRVRARHDRDHQRSRQQNREIHRPERTRSCSAEALLVIGTRTQVYRVRQTLRSKLITNRSARITFVLNVIVTPFGAPPLRTIYGRAERMDYYRDC